MAIAWADKSDSVHVSLLAESDANSWKQLTSDIRLAMARLFECMKSRLDKNKQYILLVGVWIDSGRITFHVSRKGRLISSAPIITQIYCKYIPNAFEDYISDIPEDDIEVMTNSTSAFYATIEKCLMNACDAIEVREAWGAVLEVIGDCVVYVQRGEDEDTKRITYMIIPPPNE